jgi:sodium/potassium-transporting ATPase subunit alpha
MSHGIKAHRVPTQDTDIEGGNPGVEITTKSAAHTVSPAVEEEYINLVRRVSGVDVVRRISGVDVTRKTSAGNGVGGLALQKKESSSGIVFLPRRTSSSVLLTGNAEAGVIEATRRISGIGSAIMEAAMVAGSGVIEVKVPAARCLIPKPGEYELQATFSQQEWHSMTDSDLYHALSSSIEGLSAAEHAKRLEFYGPNAITPPKQVHWFVKFCLNLVGGFQMMMWFGSILCFIVYGITNATDSQTLALGIVLIVVVVTTTIFQSYQEGKSDKVMAALRALSPSTVFVYRDNELQNVSADSLVPGDVVKVTGGDKVPADIRVISSSDLKVNNASLTGENVDIKLGAEANHKDLYEAKNVARSGCNLTSGNAVCIVFSTGDYTFFGQIASSMTKTERPDTLLKHEIHRLINIMAVVAFTLGITFFILALFNGYNWLEAIVFMIGIVVANVPEGLLPQMTVALTLTAQRMLSLGVLVSNLEIIETLGAVDIICSDKTGTLTCNRMSASHIVYNKTIHITPISPTLDGDEFEMFDSSGKCFKALQRIASLNTDAVFLASSANEPDVLKRETKGDASESAIIKFVEPIRAVAEYRETCKRVFSVPFNSSNKWMLSVHEQEDPSAEYILMVKGAPERVMNMCVSVMTEEGEQEMSDEVRQEMEDCNETLARRGERVLAFAHMVLPKSEYPSGHPFDIDLDNFPTSGLTLVGFMSLIDPPRMTVKPAIAQCNLAGIRVFMVTGDHPITAHAIAKSLNLITKPTKAELEFDGLEVGDDYREAIVVHGTEMLTFTPDDWTRVLQHKEIVFARTMPQQKQDIVRELNKLGNVVAMTGDGVNDAPALKAANVGIAMGSGATVAKEAAQIVLLNDDFGAIVDGIREGRLIFENLKKCVAYVLSSNVPEIIPFLLFIALKIPLGIETIVILLVDLGTDLAPAVALAYEEPEAAIMQVPPRDEHAHMVGPQMMFVAYGTIGVFETIAAFFGYCYVFIEYGFSVDSLIGAGIEYRTPFKDLNNERQDFFTSMCEDNSEYTDDCADGEKFLDYRLEALAGAQTAFLLAVVWGQIANILIRKTQVASIFTWERLLGNKQMNYSILLEICIIIFLTHCPGVNAVFLMRFPKPVWGACTIWIIPFILAWDETRKYLCRTYPDGWVRKYTSF